MDAIEEIEAEMNKIPARKITMEDGVSISVQASAYHYSSPRKNGVRYTHVEVGFPSVEIPELLKYIEDSTGDPTKSVYSYVPASVVLEIIKKHGGIRSGELVLLLVKH